MLDVEEDELDFHSHRLPPLNPTPRSLVTSQAGLMTSPRVHAQRSFASHDTNAELRRTLKQVSRGHREWTSGLCSACQTDRQLCKCYSVVFHCSMFCNNTCLSMGLVHFLKLVHCCLLWRPIFNSFCITGLLLFWLKRSIPIVGSLTLNKQ